MTSSPPDSPATLQRYQVLLPLAHAAGTLLARNLSKQLGRPLRVLCCRVRCGDVPEAVATVAAEESAMLGVFVVLDGDVSGRMVACIPEGRVAELGNHLLGDLPVAAAGRDRLEASALREVGNLAAGSLACVLSQTLQADVNLSVPTEALDHAGVIISHGMLAQAEEEDAVVFVHIGIGGVEGDILCDLLFLPQPSSLEWLVGALRER